MQASWAAFAYCPSGHGVHVVSWPGVGVPVSAQVLLITCVGGHVAHCVQDFSCMWGMLVVSGWLWMCAGWNTATAVGAPEPATSWPYVLSPVHLMVVSGSFPGRLMMHVNAAPVAIAMVSWRLIPTGFCAWEKPARSVFVLSPSWPAVFVPQQ